MYTEIPALNIPMGPGSQQASEEDAVLDYMKMPSQMDYYDFPVLPESEQAADCPQALALLSALQQILNNYKIGHPVLPISIAELAEDDQRLIDQILGEGEVSILFSSSQVAGRRVEIQETVLAGVWRMRELDSNDRVLFDGLEVADIPAIVVEQTFQKSGELTLEASEISRELHNSPAVISELIEHCHQRQETDGPHVTNLSLLPFSPEDHQFLDAKLGVGETTILSRGYGNCRISSTAIKPIWRVQYFNSGDQLILDTLEVVSIPEVACAAQEDISDSALRLKEIQEALL
ncbi:MAG: hydrogenase expression/formation protein [Motiliproteus sp.]|nr:hydrogenase expression/formation protein [Motiliproteus sp.]MCW9051759.1 hydrogenase expression/formation protein [Motiliproteus sp.]